MNRRDFLRRTAVGSAAWALTGRHGRALATRTRSNDGTSTAVQPGDDGWRTFELTTRVRVALKRRDMLRRAPADTSDGDAKLPVAGRHLRIQSISTSQTMMVRPLPGNANHRDTDWEDHDTAATRKCNHEDTKTRGSHEQDNG